MRVNVYGKIFLVHSVAASDWLPNSQTELKFVWKSKHTYIHSYMSVRSVLLRTELESVLNPSQSHDRTMWIPNNNSLL